MNYGILEIGSLSSNFDVALQNVKMESLFMVEEYTFDALKVNKIKFDWIILIQKNLSNIK